MTRLLFRPLAACLSIPLLAAAATPVVPLPALSPQAASEFAHPHRLVDVGGGRRMNLDCRGAGAVTVVFDAGLNDWSSIWALVQPQVASRTRACSYDRAGMGYSDPAQRAGSPLNIIDDLHTLLDKAGIAGPLVLVGHSLGGFNMKLYAASYPSQVAGMVLVDPSEELGEQRAGTALRARFGARAVQYRQSDRAEFVADMAQYSICSAAARTRDLDPDSEIFKQCTDPVRTQFGPEIAAVRKTHQVGFAYQAAQASELENSVYQVPANPALDAYYAQLFGHPHALGNLPMVILSRAIVSTVAPYGDVENVENVLLHEQTAALSSRGVHRVVPNTHHNIEIDDPQAVIDAINQVLDLQ